MSFNVRYKNNFVCLFPWLTDATAIKCTGQICNTIASKYRLETYIVTYKNEEYNNFRKYCSKTNLYFLKGKLSFKGWKLFFDLLWFVICNSKKIKILYLYHFSNDDVVIPFIGLFYKLINKHGVLYVRLEADVAELPISFPCISSCVVRDKIKNIVKIRFYKNVDILGVVDNLNFDLTKRLYLWELVNKNVKIQLNGYKYYEDIPTIQFKDKDNVIVLAGRLDSYQKGLDIFLNAIQQLDFHEWSVVLLGKLNKTQIESIIEMGNNIPRLKNKISILGHVSDVSTYMHILNRAKIFCLPSRYDGIPLVIPDAMSRGCVIVGSDLFGIKDIATNQGEFGFYFPNGDSIALYHLLEDIIRGKYNLEALSEKSRQRANELFHWDRIVDGIEIERYI